MNGPSDVLSERLAERVRQMTKARAWPWMRPGVISVGLDENGRVTRYLATATDLVPIEDVAVP